MADAFAKTRLKATEAATQQDARTHDQSHYLRELDHRQKQVLSLFKMQRFVTTKNIADLLGVHRRTALNLCKTWCDDAFLIQHGSANKSRKYELAAPWTELLD